MRGHTPADRKGTIMRDKLEKIIIVYEELEKKLADPSVASDIKEYTRLNKEYAHQTPLVTAAREYIGALDDIDAAKEMQRETTDPDEKALLQEEGAEPFQIEALPWNQFLRLRTSPLQDSCEGTREG